MSEIIKNTYLDFEGLKKYDGLIKGLISSGHKELADAIDALTAKLGTLEFEGSDDKTFAEVVNDIYASIEEIVAKQGSLDEKDAELEGKINGIVGDLESLEGLTLVEIGERLNAINESVTKNTQDIVGVTERVTAVEEAIKNLGEIEGGESLGEIVSEVKLNTAALATLKGEADVEGSVKKTAADAAAAALADAKAYADSKVDGKFDELGAAEAAKEAAIADAAEKYQVKGDYEAAGAAAQALADAQAYADGLAVNYDAAGAAEAAKEAAIADAAEKYQVKGDYEAAGTAAALDAAMDERVKALEAIDHDKIAADAVAAVVAGAESDFDTLKEVADWIASDKVGSAELQTTVSDHAKSIDTINGDIDALEAKVDDDIANLTAHMLEAATALAEVDSRLDALEAFEETHASIELKDIEDLFPQS